MVPMRTAVLGAGSWGTALAKVLGENDHRVALWTRSKEHARALSEHHENQKYLPGIVLPKTIIPRADLEAAVKDAEMVVFACPSHALRETALSCNHFIHADAVVVSASKGIETPSGATMADVLLQVLPRCRVAVLSGPSFAM